VVEQEIAGNKVFEVWLVTYGFDVWIGKEIIAAFPNKATNLAFFEMFGSF
jgi:hypothetical protein